MTRERAEFSCPDCESSDIFLVAHTDGTYECDRCGRRTHEKIEANRSDLEELAQTDARSSELASVLLGGEGE